MAKCCCTALLLAFCLCSTNALAEPPVSIRVNASVEAGAFNPVWNYFGYDEPNYTYAKNGRKLIDELAHLGRSPVHIRTHFLLTTGDGSAQCKFGSTNAYTEDASGKAVYDWSIVDKIIDTFVEAGATPLIEIGFMPKALSSHPEPYQLPWKPGDKFDHYYLGWSYPPNDYAKWHELVYQWVKHTVTKYGAAKVATWDWEVWNEPNIGYWHGTAEEYDKLYDFTADAFKRALPQGKIGGPASTGPANEKAAQFLRQFLEHCSSGKNFATGKTGAPLDFITFHAKGHPKVVDDHVEMGLSQELKDVANGFAIVHDAIKFRSLPVILTEADPEGCAACSASVYPPNAYRNGTLYPAYTAAALKGIMELAQRDSINLAGILTWAFEFENQPWFAGFRTLATNGVDKPVLNLFRMAGLMDRQFIQTESSGTVDLSTLLAQGVSEHPEVDAVATASDHGVSVLVWNYQDKNVAGPPAEINLDITKLAPPKKRVLLRHYRIDEHHSNAFSKWKSIKSPQNPDAGEYAELEQSGQLELLDSPRWINTQDGSVKLDFALPLEGLSLIQLSW